MIYVALVEMIAEDFQAAAIASNVILKVKMVSALLLGTAFLAVLAIWAKQGILLICSRAS